VFRAAVGKTDLSESKVAESGETVDRVFIEREKVNVPTEGKLDLSTTEKNKFYNLLVADAMSGYCY